MESNGNSSWMQHVGTLSAPHADGPDSRESITSNMLGALAGNVEVTHSVLLHVRLEMSHVITIQA